MTSTPSEKATVTIGGREVPIERPSGRKAAAAFGLLRHMGTAAREIGKEVGRYQREYGEANFETLSRPQARMRFGKRPLFDENGVILNADGEAVLESVGLIDQMTEEDWEKAGQVMRLPARPSQNETIAAMFPKALELAEREVFKLLALFTVSNEEVARWRKEEGGVEAHLEEATENLLDEAEFTELIELAVVAGEVVDEAFRRKSAELGERMGKALRLLGIGEAKTETAQAPPTATVEEPTTPTTGEAPATEPSSTSRPTSSSEPLETDSDGRRTSSSTPPGISSQPSITEPQSNESASGSDSKQSELSRA